MVKVKAYQLSLTLNELVKKEENKIYKEKLCDIKGKTIDRENKSLQKVLRIQFNSVSLRNKT